MPILPDDEETRDWEMKDEEPPEQLRKKWEREEAEGFKAVVCPSCKKETPGGSLTCIFCGANLDFKNEKDPCRPQGPRGKEIKSLGGETILQKRCPLCGFLRWVQQWFKKN